MGPGSATRRLRAAFCPRHECVRAAPESCRLGLHGMDRRRHRAGGAAAWRKQCHCRAADSRARPASRPRPWRRQRADAAAPAARQQRQRGVAGAARRASRHLCDRGIEAARRDAAGIVPRRLWRYPSRLDRPAVAGARSARGDLRAARTRARRFRRYRRRGRPCHSFRAGDARRARLRARVGQLCRDRRDRGPGLRLAEIRRCGVARRGRAVA